MNFRHKAEHESPEINAWCSNTGRRSNGTFEWPSILFEKLCSFIFLSRSRPGIYQETTRAWSRNRPQVRCHVRRVATRAHVTEVVSVTASVVIAPLRHGHGHGGAASLRPELILLSIKSLQSCTRSARISASTSTTEFGLLET